MIQRHITKALVVLQNLRVMSIYAPVGEKISINKSKQILVLNYRVCMMVELG